MAFLKTNNKQRVTDLYTNLANKSFTQDDINLLNRVTRLQQLKSDIVELQRLTAQNVVQLNSSTFSQHLQGNIETNINKSYSVDSNGFMTFTDHNPF